LGFKKFAGKDQIKHRADTINIHNKTSTKKEEENGELYSRKLKS